MNRILLLIAGALGACNYPGNSLPTVFVAEPSGDTTVSRGGTLAIAYTDSDFGEEALTSLYLEPAGVLAGAASYLIAADRPELDGLPQAVQFRWDPATIPAGTYRLVAATSDGSNEPVTDAAPGLVTLADVSWVRSDGGDEGDRASAIAALPDGSSFVTGFIQGTATFGEGEPLETSLVAQSVDVFVARYAADGMLAWAKRAGSARADFAQGIAAFPDGSCVVTGYFDRTATFGEGEPNQTSLTSLDDFPEAQVLGGRDIFVARYNANGTLAWATQASGADGFEQGTGIAALPDGSSIVTGWFGGAVTFGAGEVNETVLDAGAGGSDIFVARFSPDGTLAWAKRAGGAMSDNGLAISALPDGTALVAGYFSETATFGPGEAGETTVTVTGSAAFVARYGSDGMLAWVRHSTGLNVFAFGIGAAPDGSSVVTGRFTDEVTFGQGEANETTLASEAGDDDAFVARYLADGTFAWAKRAGGAGINRDEGSAIAALPDGSALVAGQVDAGATFGTGEANETMFAARGAFVARYGPGGTLAWVTLAQGVAVAGGIAALPDESPLVAGSFFEMATFGPGEADETTITVVPGDDPFADSDTYVAHYNADGSF